jgi:hypothetical protein
MTSHLLIMVVLFVVIVMFISYLLNNHHSFLVRLRLMEVEEFTSLAQGIMNVL